MAKRSADADAPLKGAGRWTRQSLPRLLLIIGPEAALRQGAIDEVRAALAGENGDALNWITMHGPANTSEAEALTAAQVLDEVCMQSMFAAGDETKVVLVRQADIFLSEYYDIFERQLDSIPETSVLIFDAANFGKLKSTNFFKKLTQRGSVVECEALVGKFGDSVELQIAVEKRARDKGLALSGEAVNAMLNRCAKNLGVILEELDKLALALRPPGQPADKLVPVSPEHIAELCANTSTYNSFDWADATINRDLKRALELLGGIFERGIADSNKPGKTITNEGTVSILLLGALTWKLSQLQDVHAALTSGRGERDAFAAGKVFGPPQRIDAFRRTLRKHTPASLRKGMNALLRANLDLRTGGAVPQQVLEKLVWDIGKS